MYFANIYISMIHVNALTKVHSARWDLFHVTVWEIYLVRLNPFITLEWPSVSRLYTPRQPGWEPGWEAYWTALLRNLGRLSEFGNNNKTPLPFVNNVSAIATWLPLKPRLSMRPLTSRRLVEVGARSNRSASSSLHCCWRWPILRDMAVAFSEDPRWPENEK